MNEKLSILLVEDEFVVAMFMQRQLKDAGYPVSHHVVSGEEAVSWVLENRPGLVLMDIRLAGDIDGVDAAAAIRAENDSIEVVFVTGYDDKGIRERAEKVKPVGFFIKPLDISKLKVVLDNIADGSNL